MDRPDLPLLIEPNQLEPLLGNDQIAIVDLSKAETYAKGHIPGSVHLDYGRIVAAQPPATGMLPSVEHLSAVFSELGLTPEHHVVTLDDEGGGRACRMLWTLAAAGHEHYSLLNGGIISWSKERHPVTADRHHAQASSYKVALHRDVVADKQYVLDHLGSGDTALLDTRSPEEFSGARKLANRGGHIPGAVNYDWVEAMDPANNYRLRPAEELSEEMQEIGVTPDKEVVVYCQTHHRSAHTFIMLKSLGYDRVRGYPGSWSEWGNDPATPVET
jgi:thiosulfate/3-mercaptopyruvate sulfurtransferase